MITISLSSCFVLMNSNYPTTSFWVTNSSNKTVNFKASVIKYSSMGTHEMTLPFTVYPNDTVLFRSVGYRKDANPINVFSQFVIFPVEGVELNNPKDSSNWIKSIDSKGKPQFIFDVNKKL